MRHRLRIAAGGDCDLFSDRALREVRRRARGIPRLVNVLCDRALLAGYAAGEKRIDRALVDSAAREILAARARRRPWRNALRRAFRAAAILLAVGLGALTWQQLGRREAPREPAPLPPVATPAPPPVEATPATDPVLDPPDAVREEAG